MTPEGKVKAGIKKYLESLSPGFFFPIVQNGYNMHGIADILGCYRGNFVSIEVKSLAAYKKPSHGLTHPQKVFGQAVTASLGYHIVTYDVEHLKTELSKFFYIVDGRD